MTRHPSSPGEPGGAAQGHHPIQHQIHVLGRAGGHHLNATPLAGEYCLNQSLDAIEDALVAGRQPPWAPGQREEVTDVERAAGASDPRWCMSQVDLFADLTPAEMGAFAAAIPDKTYAAGELIYSPHSPIEALFILKRGRVRIFRVSSEGRALTTALLMPGTIFGEMTLVGQFMHDNFAEALDEVTVCIMSRDAVHRFILANPRVAARLTEILGRRLAELERRLTDSVFKNVPQRVAGTLCRLATDKPRRMLRSGAYVALTHEQLAALVGTSRETTTKVLDEFAERGLVKIGRGRITLLDPDAIAAEAGD